MQKRGELTLKSLVELSFAALVIFGMLLIAYRFGTQEVYVQAKIAREGAASVNVFQDISGNAWLKFSGDYPISMQQNLFQVGAKPEPPSYPFAGNVIPNQIENAHGFYIYKDGRDVSIATEKPTLRKFDCEAFTVDATNPFIKATDQTRNIGQQYFLDNNACTQDNRCARSNKAFRQPSDFVVKIVQIKTKSVTIRYPPNSPEGKNAACALANKLDAQDIWLLPTSDPEVAPRGLLIEFNGISEDRIAAALREVIKLTGGFA